MKRTGLLLAIVVAFGFAPVSIATDDDDVVVEGQILIELVPGVSIEQILTRYNLNLVDGIDEWSLYQVEVNPPDTSAALIPIMALDPDLDDAEPLQLLASPEGVQETIADLDLGLTPLDFATQPGTQLVETTGNASQFQNGSGVVVAVLDTSFYLNNEMLLPRLYSRGIDIRGGLNDARFRVDGIDDDGDGLIDEAAHHGSYVAGLILLVAPNARILPVRVLNEDGQGTSFDLANGILYAIEQRVDVINLSLVLQEESQMVEKAIKRAESRGIVVVVPSGNLGIDGPEFPATMSEVISVGSVDGNGLRSAFSSYGEEVDLVAPGDSVISLFGDVEYANWSGSSFAVPWVTGAVALLLDRYPAMRPDDVREALIQTAVPVPDSPSATIEFGNGMVSAEAVGGFLFDNWTTLRVEQSDGIAQIRWSRVPNATEYAMIRGDLDQLASIGGQVTLGAVQCMVQVPLTEPVGIRADAEFPAPGMGFFYLVGDVPAVEGYGKSGQWEPRVAASGDCSP